MMTVDEGREITGAMNDNGIWCMVDCAGEINGLCRWMVYGGLCRCMVDCAGGWCMVDCAGGWCMVDCAGEMNGL